MNCECSMNAVSVSEDSKPETGVFTKALVYLTFACDHGAGGPSWPSSYPISVDEAIKLRDSLNAMEF